ncbi:hypothetical protein NEDG_01457 [Nematocida displodere]|uniref:Uncharacterized protein n=1 Tax=Nematocida displodere TaxID=1805483 RepID=A0A177EES9_9MICR|nr:hypothetical protein NEDG_01457 [Nematocida displodere]
MNERNNIVDNKTPSPAQDEAKVVARRQEKEMEKRANDEYLQLLRDQIREDRQTLAAKQQSANEEVMKTVCLDKKNLIPLCARSDSPTSSIASTGNEIALKIVYEAQNVVVSLDPNTSIASLKNLISTTFKIKAFKIYSPSNGEITTQDASSTLASECIANMDIVRVVI